MRESEPIHIRRALDSLRFEGEIKFCTLHVQTIKQRLQKT